MYDYKSKYCVGVIGKILIVLAVLLCSVLLFGTFAVGVEEPTKDTINIAPKNSNNQITSKTITNEMTVVLKSVNNTTNVNVEISNFDSTAFTSCEISAIMSCEGVITRNVSYSIAPSEFSVVKGKGTYVADFKDFGKFSVEAKILNNTTVLDQYSNNAFGVTADVYNICAFTGTMPVTLAALQLWGEDSFRKEGPVIWTMSRTESFDWANLPTANGQYYGMYGMPYLTYEQLTTPNIFYDNLDKYRQYVADLKSLNENSKFNLRCSDNDAGLLNLLIYSNGIENYTVTYLTDGNKSQKVIKAEYYGASFEANEAINNDKISEWNRQKEIAYRTLSPTKFGRKVKCIENIYSIVCADKNVTWQVIRLSTFTTLNDNDAFGTSIRNNLSVQEVSIVDLLNNNIRPSQQATMEFKALYKFNENYFEKAKRLGLPVMLILGNRNDITDLESYARLIQSSYGDQYCYYYKGHPAQPTSGSPEKQELLECLDIDDVDSNVPAELIIFFNEDIKLCGYTSSTFQSVKSGMDKAMFRMTKDEAISSKIYECFKACDFWSSEITDDTADNIKSLCNMKDRNFLLEFNDIIIESQGYDIAIWDATTAKLKYYKKSGSSYSFVKEVQGEGYTSAVANGSYIINNIANNHKVVDVDGGSFNNSANVQVYDYNNSGAQKWTVNVGTGGYCTIKNVNSGKFLDIAGGNAKDGTNVAQYEGNGTLAQKWLVVSNNGGYKITSALNRNIVLDIAGGSLANRTNIQVYSNNNSNAQTFKFANLNPVVPAGTATIAEGDYYIGSLVNSNKVVDLDGGNSDNGTKIQIWDKVDYNSSQAFHVSKEGQYYRIENMATRKSIDVDDGKVICPTKVQQWDSGTGNKNQLWAISPSTKNASTYVLTNVASGLVLDLSGGNTNNGTNIDAYEANGTAAQSWSFSPVTTAKPEIINGTFEIDSLINASSVVDVADGSKKDCANVQIYKANNTNAQKWTISTDANGVATITNVGSGKCLDIDGGRISSGTNVWQYTSNGTDAQKWKIYKKADGSYSIVSARNCFIALDLAGANTSNGSNIQVYSFNNTAAQSWGFKPIS